MADISKIKIGEEVYDIKDTTARESGGSVDIATINKAGIVKPDGTSIIVDPDGTMHSTGFILGDVSGATATINKEVASIIWSDPQDATSGVWAGTKVVRKAGSAPESVGDGTLIANVTTRNQYSSTALVDNTAYYDSVWYYRFFPYTNKGQYTAGSSVVVRPTREVTSVLLSSINVYTGDLITPTFTYDDTKVRMVQEVSATEPGTYYTPFEPLHDYMWEDGTIGVKNIEWYIVSSSLYGVEWDGTSTSAWSRTDDASSFSDPIPAVNNGTGSSPFDNLYPWSAIKRVTDPDAGELVQIPKFYYKWTLSGDTIKLQISASSASGFSISPAHMDRNDGVGERNFIYVARYNSIENTYKSETGVLPKVNNTRSEFRSAIHNLGSDIWQWDYATINTIWMLYLVEFADWNSQAKIGIGCGGKNTDSLQNTGYTDNMQYHTGTDAETKDSYGHTQYRYIEDLWGNVNTFVDGFNSLAWVSKSGIRYTFNKRYSLCGYYCNPSDFSDDANGFIIWEKSDSKSSTTAGGASVPSITGIPTKWNINTFIYPDTISTDTSYSIYTCDICYLEAYQHSSETGASKRYALALGGDYTKLTSAGLFSIYYTYYTTSITNDMLGSRLMKLPS